MKVNCQQMFDIEGSECYSQKFHLKTSPFFEKPVFMESYESVHLHPSKK